MNSTELILWTKINEFQLDVPGDEFTFSDRVARENGWTNDYTKRVIQEYKKFIYLCCCSETGVTPSDPVDQVWHLHLTYTKSYWIDFCQDTLGKQIHHNPTKGGSKEAEKFNNYYEHLKDIYRYHFDNEPPSDIWQPADVRFSDIDFQRVNLRKYWLVKKPGKRFFTMFTLIVIGFIGLISIQATEDYVFFGVIIAIVVGVSIYQRNNRKNGGGCSGNTGGSGGCSSCSGHHSGGSGCSSGCSGCSGSGCSGCGGGD